MALYHLKSSRQRVRHYLLSKMKKPIKTGMPSQMKKKNNFDSRMHAFILLHFVTANADYLLVIYLLKQMSSVG